MFARYVALRRVFCYLKGESSCVEVVYRMVADLFDAAYTEALPIVPNAALSYNISHGIPSY